MLERLRSLLRLLFVWKVRPEDSGSEPDCIIMLAFGQEIRRTPLRPGLDKIKVAPGPANEAVARALVSYLRNTLRERIPVLAQWEYLETNYGSSHNQKFPMVSLGENGEYLNTREILEEAKRYMDGNHWNTAIIVAHPWHLARCVWTAQRLGIEVFHDKELLEDLKANANKWNREVEVPQDQRQTTSLARWLPYELAARGYSWLRGWI